MKDLNGHPRRVNINMRGLQITLELPGINLHRSLSTAKSLTGDHVDINPTYVMLVVEVTNIFGIVHRRLIRYPLDLRCIQVLVKLTRIRVRGKLSLQSKEEAK
ncbi:hypothetical protein V6N11_071561 [Hibiscus sabdariffa]|uniref:Uncharacterized protein n=1 Tax=Hibiscus sabdariffa TaxID=183260 RepID=A0ABR2U0P2_9ROSI